jgi:DNA-binding MarR family transcriptional regulator
VQHLADLEAAGLIERHPRPDRTVDVAVRLPGLKALAQFLAAMHLKAERHR